jgi:hypothetical protein
VATGRLTILLVLILKWTPFAGPRAVETNVESRLPFAFSSSSKNPLSRFLLLFLLYCGYVGNAFALSNTNAECDILNESIRWEKQKAGEMGEDHILKVRSSPDCDPQRMRVAVGAFNSAKTASTKR